MRRKKERVRLYRLKLARRCVVVLLLFICAFFCISLLKSPQIESDADSVSSFTSQKDAVLSVVPHEMSQEESVQEKLKLLEKEFPSGTYWNHRGVEIPDGSPNWAITTDIPCDHSTYGDAYCNRYNGATKEFFPQYDYLTQCLGFSSMLSDQIFGEDAPIKIHRDFNDLRPGDQIRLTGSWHSMLVIEKLENHVSVAECDEDAITCEISWGREISKNELMSYGEEIEYITRYTD